MVVLEEGGSFVYEFLVVRRRLSPNSSEFLKTIEMPCGSGVHKGGSLEKLAD